MAVNIYKGRKTPDLKRFGGTTALQAEIAPGLENNTIRQIARQLQKQIGDTNGAIGIRMISIDFALIYEPDEGLKRC